MQTPNSGGNNRELSPAACAEPKARVRQTAWADYCTQINSVEDTIRFTVISWHPFTCRFIMLSVDKLATAIKNPSVRQKNYIIKEVCWFFCIIEVGIKLDFRHSKNNNNPGMYISKNLWHCAKRAWFHKKWAAVHTSTVENFASWLWEIFKIILIWGKKEWQSDDVHIFERCFTSEE